MIYEIQQPNRKPFESLQRLFSVEVSPSKKVINRNIVLVQSGKKEIETSLQKTHYVVCKRVFDIVFSVTVIATILWWLIPLIAFIIKLDSRGPVFFRQKRTGKNNKSFTCIKFRSLQVNDEAHTRQVTMGDNRITRVGAVLRKYNLDELPQFINVLVGDMSVVGPRPHMIKHTEDFSRQLHYFMLRHTVKPGITGLAQINGFRGEIRNARDLKKRVTFDIAYIKRWSILLDIKIIIGTMIKAYGKKNNAF